MPSGCVGTLVGLVEGPVVGREVGEIVGLTVDDTGLTVFGLAVGTIVCNSLNVGFSVLVKSLNVGLSDTIEGNESANEGCIVRSGDRVGIVGTLPVGVSAVDGDIVGKPVGKGLSSLLPIVFVRNNIVRMIAKPRTQKEAAIAA